MFDVSRTFRTLFLYDRIMVWLDLDVGKYPFLASASHISSSFNLICFSLFQGCILFRFGVNVGSILVPGGHQSTIEHLCEFARRDALGGVKGGVARNIT